MVEYFKTDLLKFIHDIFLHFSCSQHIQKVPNYADFLKYMVIQEVMQHL